MSKKNQSNQDVFLKKLKFKLYRNKQAYVVSGTKLGCPKEVEIPSQIKNKPVVGIGKKAFYDSKITSIKIPDTVTFISNKSFSHCRRLTSVEMSSSLVAVGKKAFRGCKRLPSVYLPESAVIVRKKAFDGCKNLTIKCERSAPAPFLRRKWNSRCPVLYGEEKEFLGSQKDNLNDTSNYMPVKSPAAVKGDGVLEFEYHDVTNSYIVAGLGSYNKEELIIPAIYNGKTVSAIKSNAFENCSSIKSVVIPASVALVGPSAFLGCSSLKTVTIESGEQEQIVYKNAFRSCSTLSSVTIGSAVCEISADAFLACTSLEKFVVDENNKTYCSVNGILYSKDMATLICCPSYANPRIVVPNGVTTIGSCAFACSGGLERVTLPETVTAIEDGAFGVCKFLKLIQLPESLTSIGEKAFQGCINMPRITIPKNVKYIGANAFFHCKSLDITCNLPEMPESWNENWNPDGCSVEWTKPVSISIEEEDEDSSSGLSYSLYAQTDSYIVTGIGSCNDVSIIIPSRYNGKIVSAIGPRAFANNKSIQEVEFPSSVVIIAPEAFSGCENLDTVRFNDGIRSIRDNAFANCTSISKVFLPASISEISANAFYGCSAIAKFDVAPQNSTFLSDDDVLYSKDFSTLISYPPARWTTLFNVPSSVTAISSCAFQGAKFLEQIFIGSGVESIGENALKCNSIPYISCDFAGKPQGWHDNWNPYDFAVNWTKIAEEEAVSVEEEVISVEEEVVSVEEEVISVEEEVISVEEEVISVEEEIVSVEEEVISVEEEVVSTEEEVISVEEEVISVEEEVVSTEEEVISVEEEVVSVEEEVVSVEESEESNEIELSLNKNGNAYAVKGKGGYTSTDIEIPCEYEGIPVTSVAKMSFKGSDITSIKLSENITFIGDKSFADCYSLSYVEFNEGIKYINNSSFSNCTALTSLFFPDSLKQIGEYSFKGCNSLTDVSISDSTIIDKSAFADCPNLTITIRNSVALDPAEEIAVEEIIIEEPVIEELVIEEPVIEELIIEEPVIEELIIEEPVIEEIIIDETVETITKQVAYSQGLEFSLNKKGDSYAVKGIGSCTDSIVNIPDTYNGLPVTSIGKWAFKGCSLSGLSLPSSISYIGDKAFANCQSLETVTLSNGIKYINEGAFYNCSNLETVNFPSTLKTISFWAFKDCVSLKEVKLSKEVSVDSSAFDGCGVSIERCDNIPEIVLVEEIDTLVSEITIDDIDIDEITLVEPVIEEIIIEEPVIEELIIEEPVIEEIIIDETVETITKQVAYSQGLEFSLNKKGDSYAVKGIGSCTDSVVAIPDTYNGLPVTSIIKSAFKSCTICGLIVPSSVVFIDERAAWGCHNLESVTLSEGIKYINIGAFMGCYKLAKINFPSSLKKIDAWAFNGCTSLTSIKLMNTVSVNNSAFDGCDVDIIKCSDAKELTPIAVTPVVSDLTIEDIDIDQLILGEPALEEIVIDEPVLEELIIDEIDETITEEVTYSQGLEFSLNKKGNSYAVKGMGSCADRIVAIPDTYNGLPVTSIMKGAFRKGGFESVSIPSSITFIDERAFMECEQLTSVTLANGIKYINAGAFADCTSLSSINFPATLKTIGFWAFKNCTALTNRDVPTTVTIDPSAFAGC